MVSSSKKLASQDDSKESSQNQDDAKEMIPKDSIGNTQEVTEVASRVRTTAAPIANRNFPFRRKLINWRVMDRRPARADYGGTDDLQNYRRYEGKISSMEMDNSDDDKYWRDDEGRFSSDCILNYSFGQKVGMGSYGAVYVGRFADGSICAIKKLTMPERRRDGISKSCIRELIILRELEKFPHSNIVDLRGICLTQPAKEHVRGIIYTIFENINKSK